MQHLSLFELNNLVRQTIDLGLPRAYWVEAEVAEMRENSGHCYMELIEKDPRYNTPIARASAKCWRQTWGAVKPYFERETGQHLRTGMKILVEVTAQFHEAYGFSWIITDIDPQFSLGDMARRRQEIIRRLKEEGVFDLNKQLPLPLFTQRIAVISSETAAGYGDFLSQLANNSYGYHFKVTLFPTIMQGEGIEKSIIKALDIINDNYDDYDCVVITRGGGATSDMSGFDTLELAENVANFPLPVITGIGHDRDECILDMVSHTRVKTPTAAATLLIDHLHAIDMRINDYSQRLANCATRIMDTERQRLQRLTDRIPTMMTMATERQKARLDIINERLSRHAILALSTQRERVAQLEQRMPPAIEHTLLTARHQLEMLQNRTANLDPQQLLKRGYSITLHNGKALTDPSQVRRGDIIETRLKEGIIRSTIN